jgi:hypothetical protein
MGDDDLVFFLNDRHEVVACDSDIFQLLFRSALLVSLLDGISTQGNHDAFTGLWWPDGHIALSSSPEEPSVGILMYNPTEGKDNHCCRGFAFLN